jgi:hypothetical protein
MRTYNYSGKQEKRDKILPTHNMAARNRNTLRLNMAVSRTGKVQRKRGVLNGPIDKEKEGRHDRASQFVIYLMSLLAGHTVTASCD